VSERLTSIVRALATLTASERRALAGTLNDKGYEEIAPILGGTPKAASQAAYRARRELAAALPRAA
jgi:DNA-directed RNA polymerase specialized sigma24 family protein